jgi:hypothetical protein
MLLGGFDSTSPAAPPSTQARFDRLRGGMVGKPLTIGQFLCALVMWPASVGGVLAMRYYVNRVSL